MFLAFAIIGFVVFFFMIELMIFRFKCGFLNLIRNFHKYIRTSNYDYIHVDIDVCTDNIKPNFPVIFIMLLILLQILVLA